MFFLSLYLSSNLFSIISLIKYHKIFISLLPILSLFQIFIFNVLSVTVLIIKYLELSFFITSHHYSKLDSNIKSSFYRSIYHQIFSPLTLLSLLQILNIRPLWRHQLSIWLHVHSTRQHKCFMRMSQMWSSVQSRMWQWRFFVPEWMFTQEDIVPKE